jgi:hypothetical protein
MSFLYVSHGGKPQTAAASRIDGASGVSITRSQRPRRVYNFPTSA